MKRLGVIGTMVWDTIHGRGGTSGPVEEWGGIAYSLSALEAALPSDWHIVPLIKVGRDLAPSANGFLAGLTRRPGAARFVEVPNPNNRVVLRYESSDRRSECLTGGVPGWRWAELGPMVRDVDALYVNFISGWELDLETARLLRQGFTGPIYADLHSLSLGVAADGLRIPQPLPDVESWAGCFDVVQMNEAELHLIGADPMEIAARLMASGTRLLVVTLGARGAVYFAVDPFTLEPGPRTPRGPIRTARVAALAALEDGDPTGCGDVFGATLLSRLVHGDDVEAAIRSATAAAARNLTHRGASGLHRHLRGELATR